ncbi:MAG TPA: hypothetical protein VF597_00585 [Candidatus Saccharimonadales bacterium]|jgi:hypothetical protein
MNDAEKFEVLLVQIEVMKLKIAENNSVHDTMMNRIYTLLAAELAIISLVVSDILRIPAPTTIAGNIFFYGAVTFMILSGGLLLYSYRPKDNWPSPMGEHEVELMNSADTPYGAMKILYQDYRLCYKLGQNIITPIARMLSAALFLFIISVIILIVLKFGG